MVCRRCDRRGCPACGVRGDQRRGRCAGPSDTPRSRPAEIAATLSARNACDAGPRTMAGRPRVRRGRACRLRPAGKRTDDGSPQAAAKRRTDHRAAVFSKIGPHRRLLGGRARQGGHGGRDERRDRAGLGPCCRSRSAPYGEGHGSGCGGRTGAGRERLTSPTGESLLSNGYKLPENRFFFAEVPGVYEPARSVN